MRTPKHEGPTKNKAAYSRIILLIKITRVFTCIMAVYEIKTVYRHAYKHLKAGVITGKTKKCRWLHLNYGIRVSYFQSGDIALKSMVMKCGEIVWNAENCSRV